MSRLAAKDKMHNIIAHANPSASPNRKQNGGRGMGVRGLTHDLQ